MVNKINWYPGHMKKSLEELQDNIKKCDVIIYVLDARCPKSCLNPSFEQFTQRKPVIFYYSKRDLATGKIPSRIEVIPEIQKLFPKKVGFVKAMVIGVPNVGKSTLINKLAKRKKTKTQDTPGTTRHTQWVEVAKNIYLLDTPGILWPNLEDQDVAKDLIAIGAIKRELFNADEYK